MKKFIPTLSILLCFIFILSISSNVFAAEKPDPNKSFKSMSIYYKKDFSGWLWFKSSSQCCQEVYFKDKDSAIEFADSITFTNAENWANYGYSTAIGFLPGGAVAGAIAAAIITWQGNERNDVAEKLKKLARKNNGKVCFFMYYSIQDGKIYGNPTGNCKVWDGKTIYEMKTNTYPIKSLKYKY